jgi:hypothetical protein
VNPFRANEDPDGQGYRYGDTIYVREKLESRDKRLDSEGNETGSGTEDQQYFGKILSALSSEDFKVEESLFTSITPTPGGKTFYKYFGGENAGVYEVDKDGLKQGDNTITIPVLQSIYRTAIK